jgi:group I intron endonuclease
MVNYENGQIYALRNYVNDLVYIGATTVGLSARMAQHRKQWKEEKNCNRKIYRAFTELGVENFYITQIEACPSKNLNELLAREGFYIRLFDTVNNGYNGNCPCGAYVGLSQKERDHLRWRSNADYRERMREYRKSWWKGFYEAGGKRRGRAVPAKSPCSRREDLREDLREDCTVGEYGISRGLAGA